jgi:uncharacterized protein
MNVFSWIRMMGAAALVGLALAHGAYAQSQPSAAAVALAREVVEMKGAIGMFDTVIPGVIEFQKRALLAANALLQKDLDEVATRLNKEYAARRAEVHSEIARAYASRFTDAELKDIVAFYKTPLGKKLITEEAAGLDEATKRVDAWSQKFADEVLARFRAEMKKKGHNL